MPGLSAVDCLLLVDGAEASCDALQFDFPEEPFRPWAKCSLVNRAFLLRRRPVAPSGATQSKAVAKIDNTGDLASMPTGSLESSNTFMWCDSMERSKPLHASA